MRLKIKYQSSGLPAMNVEMVLEKNSGMVVAVAIKVVAKDIQKLTYTKCNYGFILITCDVLKLKRIVGCFLKILQLKCFSFSFR